MKVKTLLKKCDTGFNLYIIQDKDTGHGPISYDRKEDIIADFGSWNIDGWEIGFDVINNKPFACIMITV